VFSAPSAVKNYLKISFRTGNISEKLPIINIEANQFGKSGDKIS
jgi:hypothetical protein